MKNIFINIKQLLKAEETPLPLHKGKEMQQIGKIDNAYLIIEDNKFKKFGSMDSISQQEIAKFDEIIDLNNEQIIIPAFIDSHTHIVYAGNREQEYVDKIKGLSYEEIARRGGGILNSAKLLRQTSEDELYNQAKKRVKEIMSFGTSAVEIKSGYGLDTHNELKMLRVIRRLQQTMPLTIIPTFLGAHAFPPEYKENHKAYVDKIINEMLPRVAEEKLAQNIDVFCDKGFFSLKDTDRILTAAEKYGLTPKIHANELDISGGVQVGVKHNALSVDHLERIGDNEIEALKNSNTMPTVLPGTSFFLNIPLSPARKMIDAGLPVAMASDYNPGSSPSGNMKFILTMACTKYKLLPYEALNAVTINTAYALGISKTHGSITPDKYADFIITKKIPSFEFLPYSFGNNLIDKVFIKGKEI